MERDRHNDEAARALLIHLNTLPYRLRRFCELIGKNLSSTGDLTEVWPAPRAAKTLGELS
nr:helix-turn-helix domain-containing protein [Streptomyces sp. NBC_00830]